MISRQLKIYSPVITPRLEYVSEIIFGTILGVNYELVSDRRKIGSNPSIVYSGEKIDAAFIVRPAGLIASSAIEPVQPEVGKVDDMPVIFVTGDGSLPFDIFSASFFMLSRYEEYLPYARDVHGRFAGQKSFAYRNGFLQLPVVDMWAAYLASALVKIFPVLTFRHNDYRALLTIDVDQPFAYRSKSLLRNVGGFVRDLASGKNSSSERIKTVMGREDDPYDTFGYIEETAGKSGTDLLFFFSLGDHGEYDHSPSFRDHAYQEIIKRCDRIYETGLHPSYYSFGRQKSLENESERYRHVTGHKPLKARQHWLLLTMPSLYRSFERAGIEYDYTLGFADETGFRAGIARPFRFYDLKEERMSSLTLVPFQVMDGTLRQYKNLNTVAAIDEIKNLIAVTRKAGGLFVSIWHNTSLTECEGWEGWKEVYEATLLLQRP